MISMYVRLTREEEEACDLLGLNKNELMIARQWEIDSLSDTEKKICELSGNNPLDYLRMKKLVDKEQRALNELSSEELRICKATGIDPVDFHQRKLAGC